MIFSVIVTSPPEREAASTALQFCRALLRNKHKLHLLMFIGEGVLNTASSSPLRHAWYEFITEYPIEAMCCINSAIRYGISDKKNPAISGFDGKIQVAGLGQLVQAEAVSERLICFGQQDDTLPHSQP